MNKADASLLNPKRILLDVHRKMFIIYDGLDIYCSSFEKYYEGKLNFYNVGQATSNPEMLTVLRDTEKTRIIFSYADSYVVNWNIDV